MKPKLFRFAFFFNWQQNMDIIDELSQMFPELICLLFFKKGSVSVAINSFFFLPFLPTSSVSDFEVNLIRERIKCLFTELSMLKPFISVQLDNSLRNPY